MEITPQIKAYFDAKKGNFDTIDNYFADDVCIEDTGENDTINGCDNCRKWLKEKNQQHKMETEIIEIKAEENGRIISTLFESFLISSSRFFLSIMNASLQPVKIPL